MIYIFLFIIGSIFGSFANLVVRRRLRGESIVFPRSHCESCGKSLSPFELIPVISFLIQKGRCRSCGSKISPDNIFMEIIGGILLIISSLYGLNLRTCMIFASLIIGLIISLIDLKTMEIYRKDLIMLIALGLGYRFNFFTRDFLIHIIIFSLVYYLLYRLSGRNIGDGDYYFYLGLGLLLNDSLFTIFVLFSIWIGGFFGLLILLRERKRGRRMPFAIFIYLSYIIVLIIYEGAVL
ncbi:prepilin peptidase [Anaerococcus prevotii]|uniref:Peptidase A24A domain protein n=1 Tax=Anaerococcus prevotii (strain ATCC 9321 / DSM 20548 / JCM 6508 / NCTC 11806 / PC1) TaxID=525919 RepID=C7RGS8_ANAPD|nr:A24 family peptidase [Anaerococcus prevotii]ACV28689.1 peptidase A24A domain protein [Anaerococcus prevotii DSM 20548]